MQGPFPEIRFMVSGGVSLKNVAEYLEIGVTGICLGSSYLGELLAKAGKKAFVREVRKFVSTCKQDAVAQKKF
jgi:2-keto-3-deoxy-6-phosphogluconate aldolase